jgi:hypothetical protein
MKEYILIAKGHREIWDKVSDQEWDQVMEGFGQWITKLKNDQLWVRSGRLTGKRIEISLKQSDFKITGGPFTETKELTGFFIFLAPNIQSATETAKGCPSLLHDSLSLHELEGDRS